MRRWSSPVLVLAVAAAGLPGLGARPQAPAAQPQAVQIRHEPVQCFMAERYPEIDACFEPGAPVDARVYFRAEASARWHWVPMKPVGSCYRGTLPRPLAGSGRVLYYLTATVPGRAEARSPLHTGLVVTDEKACPGGRVGPFLSAANVTVDGGALPAGFIGIEGPVSHAAKRVIAAVVGAGAVGAGIALGARASRGTGATQSPDTTLPPPASTSTTVLAPPTTTSTTTTTLPPPPTTTTTSSTTTTTTQPPPTTTTTTRPPATTTTTTSSSTTTTTTLPPPTTTTSTTTTTTRPPPTTTTTTSSTTTTTTTTLPPPTTTTSTTTTSTTTTTTQPPATTTTTAPTTTTTLPATTTTTTPTTTTTTVPATTTTTTKTPAAVRIVRTTATTLNRMLALLRRTEARRSLPSVANEVRAAGRWVWTSELAVGGGRGQVVLNGTEVSYPGPGRTEIVALARPGTNTVEVVLVDGAGRPGTWTFTLAAGAIRGGSLRVVAGEAAAVGPQAVVLRLHGRPGERAVFSFEGE